MDLKQLRTFIRVAESGSLSKASDRLRLAQPALSRQIRMLEDEVGLELFIRHGRGMQLTDAGHDLLIRLGGLIRQIDQSIDEVRAQSSTITGQVALGMMPTISYVLASRIARRVASELPGVSLRIVEGYAGHLVEWLQRGELDATFLYGPAADFHLRVHELLYEELVLVGHRDSEIRGMNESSFASLAKRELVLPSRSHGLRAVVDQAATKAKVRLNIRFEADSFRVLKDLVASGLGYTILPKSAMSDDEAMSSFATTALRRPKVHRHVIFALPSSRVDTRATRSVSQIVLDEVAAMVKAGQWRATPTKFLSERPEPPRGIADR